MANTEPDIRRGKIRQPIGTNPTVVLQAAELDARSRLAEGEEIFDLRLGPGVTVKGDAVMEWPYSHQVVKPGGRRGPDRRQ